MLEAKFQTLINKVLEVQSLHLESDEPELFYSRNWEFIFSDFDGWLVLKCYSKKGQGGYWLYPMLHPIDIIDDLKQNLPSFSFSQPSAAYGEVISGEKHWLEPFWGESKSFLDAQIPFFFSRTYYGYPPGKENYIEFNQLVTHPLDLHWSESKKSFCIINEYGDEVEKIKLINTEDVELILIRRLTLEKLLYLGNWFLIRFFDFNRYNNKGFIDYSSCTTEIVHSKKFEAKYEIRKKEDLFIEFRGAEIFRPKTAKEELLNWNFEDPESEEEKYAKFIVYDWKNKKLLKNYSIKPDNFSNYFTESDLPFGTSPIFFNAEVLDKYKNNPLKYDLKERSISCKGGWYLKTYDINAHNQVHTYAVYLSRLPYKEQLHWLQFNEEPKGGISKRAYQTDFEGVPPDEMSKFGKLKVALEKLQNVKIEGELYSIWSPKKDTWESTAKTLHFVNTENPNQWHDFIIALTNVTNEGFQTKTLRKIASKFGERDKQLRSLGLIKSILKASGNEEHIPTIHGTLNELQIKRGKGKAHGTWETPSGSLIEDASQRLSDVIEALEKLYEILENLEIYESNDKP